MTNKTISVIVPIYNTEKYLAECIDSIVAQTYSNLEILLIDDGSTDGCGIICDGYAKSDARVTVFHQQNQGQSAAKNLGISKASGDFLYFADSDDVLHRELIELLYTCSIQYDADIVQCRHGKDKSLLEQHYEAVKPELLSSIEAMKTLHDNDLYFDSTVMWTKLFRKELFQDLQFAHLTCHEDFDLVYRLFHKSHRIAFIDLALYYYRYSETSISNADFSLQKLDAVTASEQKYEFMKNIGDMELADKALKNVADLYFLSYFKCRWYIPDSQQIYKSLLSKSRRIYKKVLTAVHIPLKSKVKYSFFVLFPGPLYMIIKLTRGKFIIAKYIRN